MVECHFDNVFISGKLFGNVYLTAIEQNDCACNLLYFSIKSNCTNYSNIKISFFVNKVIPNK